MSRGYQGYHDQFEPAWPGRRVLLESDIVEARRIYEISWRVRLSQLDWTKMCRYRITDAVNITDKAIAYAIRESHRN